MPPNLTDDEIASLRQAAYNSTVTAVRKVHDELLVLRVRPDGGIPEYRAGQYTTLGLGYWEPRAPDTQAEHLAGDELRKMVKRAYSMSFPILDDSGELLTPAECAFLEFYVALVRESPGTPPALTPRLFHLSCGDRLFVGPKITGHYTLAPVAAGMHVIFLATGTGEAPHNGMIAELLQRRHSGKIVSVVCVRRQTDLAYLSTHVALERRYPGYCYVVLTTRDPINLDRNRPDFVGKQYIQDLIESGRLEARLGYRLNPGRTHVFVCGNPAMIGIPHTEDDGRHVYPLPIGVVEILERRGFRLDERRRTGNIHVEKYW